MASPIVALEIGTTKVRAIVAEPNVDDSLNILGVGECASRGVRKSDIVHVENAVTCVRNALHRASEISGVSIGQVYLLVSGGHIQCTINPGSIPLTGGGEITREDIDHVYAAARAINLPVEREILHTISQHFYIDEKLGVMNPLGMVGAKLAVDMLILHGQRSQLLNVVKVAREVPVDVSSAAYSGLCAALAVLSPEEKQNGAVVIDLGGGTTNFVAYAGGAISIAGAFGVGGDHLTNDLARGLRLTLSQAEQLKESSGSAVVDRSARLQKVEVPADSPGTPKRFVKLGDVHTITSSRIEEIFQLVKGALDQRDLRHHLGAGVILTGGGASLRDAPTLASQVFGLSCALGRPRDVNGMDLKTGHEYASPLGLLRYVQRTALGKKKKKMWWPKLFER